jgi:phosphohistidine phosphatase SixA
MRAMQMPAVVWALRTSAMGAAIAIAVAGGGLAQALTGSELVNALRQGGYVFVMRHANSPPTRADTSTAAPGNTRLERQLNENGHKTAKAMGDALRALQIPIGEVLSSPTFRTRETAVDLAVGPVKTFLELGDGSPGYEVTSFKDGTAFLRAQAAAVPPPGTNRLIITHIPNIEYAFANASDVAEGEALVFRADGKLGQQVARIKIEEWPRLAAPR